MHPHLTDVLSRLDRSREVLRTAIDAVPEHLQRTRPSPDRWSVAEVVEHLALVDRFFAERMADAIDSARAAGVGPERQAREPLSEEILRRMADRVDRREAREAVSPSGTLSAEEAWDALDQARQQVRSVVAGADGLALGSVRAEHRAFGSLTIYQWVELTAAHEVRHADQIREIGSALRH